MFNSVFNDYVTLKVEFVYEDCASGWRPLLAVLPSFDLIRSTTLTPLI